MNRLVYKFDGTETNQYIEPLTGFDSYRESEANSTARERYQIAQMQRMEPEKSVSEVLMKRLNVKPHEIPGHSDREFMGLEPTSKLAMKNASATTLESGYT